MIAIAPKFECDDEHTALDHGQSRKRRTQTYQTKQQTASQTQPLLQSVRLCHPTAYPRKSETLAALMCYVLSWFQASYQTGILPSWDVVQGLNLSSNSMSNSCRTRYPTRLCYIDTHHEQKRILMQVN